MDHVSWVYIIKQLFMENYIITVTGIFMLSVIIGHPQHIIADKKFCVKPVVASN